MENDPIKKIFTPDMLSFFHAVTTSVHAIHNLEEMLHCIIGKIRSVLNIEGASLAIHDAGRNEFYFIRTVEVGKTGDYEKMDRMRFPDHLGVAGQVLREGRSIIIPDASKDGRIYRRFESDDSFVVRSQVCVPLKTRKGIIGVFYALNKLKGSFTPNDAKILEVLSGTIAVAIENALLYGELETHIDSLHEENLRLRSEIGARYDFSELVGSSRAMEELFYLMEKVIDVPTTVLVRGDTGTGKELVARAIHYNGPRKEKPFVAESCGALSENLLESELFGHVKGAFTGALADKKGIFERADGGTVFLDEIGEMSPVMQVKLLRVLQEGQLRPVGGSAYRSTDVRLIAATHRDLDDEVRRGNFRRDLFYRINVFQIVLPPLKERKEDVPLLVNHFLKKFAKNFGGPPSTITTEALDLLSRFDWPGNVRELENEIERALTLAGRKKPIGKEDLSEKIRAPMDEAMAIKPSQGKLHDASRTIEKQMIREALRKTKGNRSQAARLLGLSRQGLINKIERYNIVP
jgi:Nif-specific regulatory protein